LAEHERTGTFPPFLRFSDSFFQSTLSWVFLHGTVHALFFGEYSTVADVKKVVLAYSGGLDTSVILRWLLDTYQCEVVAFCADLGQGEELAPVEEKAKKVGASKIYIDDLREEFVRDFVFPMLRANAFYEGGYLLGTSIARPLIAKRQIEIARQENADAVSHGATGKGNDQVRFELTYYALEPNIQVIAPWRIWDMRSRSDLITYSEARNIPIPVTKEKPYSTDRNLLHISYEGGILEDPWLEPYEDMFVLSVSPEKAPNTPEYIEINFAAGNPVSVNGEPLTPAALLAKLNTLGGKHGIGRLDLVENRYVGMKSRGVYETPGGTILHVAHRAIESITLDREVMHLRDSFIPRYAEMVYYGYWFAPEREMLQVAIDEAQKNVTGTVRLKLYKGNVSIAGRKSDKTLYNPQVATFEAGGDYRQADAEGFIRLNALRLRLRAVAQK
jgi:argininosuccinate synthase